MKSLLRRRLVDEIARVSEMPVDAVDRLVEAPKRAEHGDFAFPSFSLAKVWKCAPPAAAERLKGLVVLPEGFESASAIGPFLNLRLERGAFVRSVVNAILAGERPKGKPSRVVLEYSSPNIAKPFHVGHLRATLIGSSLDKVYRLLGHEVISVNHLGDWGTQFGYVWAGCQLWGRPSEGGVLELVELYRRATHLRELQEKAAGGEGQLTSADADYPNINDIARSYFLDLEEGKPYAREFWQWCSDISLQYFRETYRRLNVVFDHYTGESFYFSMLDAIRRELEKENLLVESMGALGVELGVDSETGDDLGFARVYTPDGRSLYLTRDIAAAKYRAATFDFDRSIYVVGAPQTLHFKQLKGILRRLGASYVDRMAHVAFGHVLGMKTRGDGEFVELNDLLDEGNRRALQAYREQVTKRPEGLDEDEVAPAVALSAIVFSTLSRTRMKDVQFSWETALQFQGDSGPYLLYALARVNGVREKARGVGLEVPRSVAGVHLTDEQAFALASLLSDFDDILARTLAESEPSHLASYGLDLARTFARVYQEIHVINVAPAVAEERLALFVATSTVLRQVLLLLGMTPLERM